MEQVFEHKKYCTGCGVCAKKCPQAAIVLKPDLMGFLYPHIDSVKCVDCGLCRTVCHMLMPISDEGKTEQIFALKSKNATVLQTSQSGGAFAEMAKCVLSTGGVVYGASFDAQFFVKHIRVSNESELHKLQGSKYVQSETTEIFSLVKSDLDKGVEVLFSGTPCQVAALNSFLTKPYEKLCTVDVVCQGIMPPKLWGDYMAYVSGKYGTFTHANFRDKAVSGWRVQYESFTINGERKVFDTYKRLFYSNYFLRDACYKPEVQRIICKYGGMVRCSDLTIGDFWGIEKTESNIPDENTGISLCLVNSSKGAQLIGKISDRVFLEKHSEAEITPRNPHLQDGDVYLPLKAEQARNEYIKHGFIYVAKKYAEAGLKGDIIKVLRRVKHGLKAILNH